MKSTLNFLLSGVGGQGIILASDVLVHVGLAAGYQAKQAEVHGMSQRGGCVTSFVRWGEVVHSPLVGAGEVDVLVAFEKLEALRVVTQLRPGALVLINNKVIEPLSVISGQQRYPSDASIQSAFASVPAHAELIDGEAIAGELGNSRIANTVLLGALSALLERQAGAGYPKVDVDLWLKVISELLPPAHVGINQKAFKAGREIIKKSIEFSPA